VRKGEAAAVCAHTRLPCMHSRTRTHAHTHAGGGRIEGSH
jgi:hypothetical protein